MPNSDISETLAVGPPPKKAKVDKVVEPKWIVDFRHEAAEREAARERRHLEKMEAMKSCERLMKQLLDKM